MHPYITGILVGERIADLRREAENDRLTRGQRRSRRRRREEAAAAAAAQLHIPQQRGTRPESPAARERVNA